MSFSLSVRSYMTKLYIIYTSIVYLRNKARGGVVYGQYTTVKDCSYAQRRVPGYSPILAVYHKDSKCFIAIINWLPT